MTEHDPDELLDVPEAASLLHLKETTVRKWLLLKRLEYLKVGGRVFIKRSQVEKVLAEAVVHAQEKPPTRVTRTKKKPSSPVMIQARQKGTPATGRTVAGAEAPLGPQHNASSLWQI